MALFEGACVNYRDPGPRRVWKGVSEPQSHLPLPDENDENDGNDTSSVGLIFEQPSPTLGQFCPNMNYLMLNFVDASYTFALHGSNSSNIKYQTANSK